MKSDTNLLATGLMLVLLVGSLGGCAGPAKVTETTKPMAGNYDDAENQIITGNVVETMDAGGYTYVCLEKGGKKTWVAMPAMKVAVGDNLRLYPGPVMPGFTSKALNRTFDEIIFSGGPVKEKSNQQAPGAPVKAAVKNVSGESKLPPVLAGKIVETMTTGNYTYICLEKDGRRSWSAVPATEVKLGDTVEILPGTEMGKFTSKSLNRTFDEIYFSSGVKSDGDKPAAQPASPSPAMPAGHPPLSSNATLGQSPAAAGPAAAPPKLAGKIVETADAGGYTYLCLEKDGKKTWAAVPTMKVVVGNEIELTPGVEMKQFPSKTLNRTFESIVFSSGPIKK